MQLWKCMSRVTTLERCAQMSFRASGLGWCATRKSTTKCQKDKTFVFWFGFRLIFWQQRQPCRSACPTQRSCRGSIFEARRQACPSSELERRDRVWPRLETLSTVVPGQTVWRRTISCRDEGPCPNWKSRPRTTRRNRFRQCFQNLFVLKT